MEMQAEGSIHCLRWFRRASKCRLAVNHNHAYSVACGLEAYSLLMSGNLSSTGINCLRFARLYTSNSCYKNIVRDSVLPSSSSMSIRTMKLKWSASSMSSCIVHVTNSNNTETAGVITSLRMCYNEEFMPKCHARITNLQSINLKPNLPKTPKIVVMGVVPGKSLTSKGLQ